MKTSRSFKLMGAIFVAVFAAASASAQSNNLGRKPSSSIGRGARVIPITDSDFSDISQTSDCVAGQGDDSWQLTLTQAKDLTIMVSDCCCPGDFYEVRINGELIGTTPNLGPPWGCSFTGPTSVGSFTKSLCAGTYTITIRDAGFDGHSAAEIAQQNMCPAGFFIAGTLSAPTSDACLSLSPSHLDIATGGVAPNDNVFSVSGSTSPSILFSSVLKSDIGGQSDARLAIDNHANPTKGLVTAMAQGSSGVFDLVASLGSTHTKPSSVTVPPQALIQVIIGEAEGTGDTAERAVAIVLRNRLSSPLRFCQAGGFVPCTTYNEAIFAPQQFASTKTSRFVDAISWQTALSQSEYKRALANAAAVFDNRESASLSGAIAFGSPGALPAADQKREISKLQDALNTCPKAAANSLGLDRRWFPIFSFKEQALVVGGIPMPTFVFVRPYSTGDCAVINIPFQ